RPPRQPAGGVATPPRAEGGWARDRAEGGHAAALPDRAGGRRRHPRLLRPVLDRRARRLQGGGGSRAKGGAMSSIETRVEPVRRSVVVNRPVEDAFRVFTEEIGKWWALDVHSLSLGRTGAPAETAYMEGRVGGRLYERMSDGAEADWGRLHVWDPPHRVAFEWFVTGTPTDV